MHLYKKRAKPGTVFKFPEGNFTLTNGDNNSLIRVNVSLVITIPINLQPDFYCQVKVFAGCSVRLEYEAGLNVVAPEGVFIEGGQTFTICFNGEADELNEIEVIRNRPVSNDLWVKIGTLSNENHIYDRIALGFETGRLRVKDGKTMLYESPEAWSTIAKIGGEGAVFDFDALNPENKELEIWFSDPRCLNFSGNYTFLKTVHFDFIDWSLYPVGQAIFVTRAHLITGVLTLPKTSPLWLNTCDHHEARLVLANYDGETLNMQGCNVDDYEGDIIIEDKANLKTLVLGNFQKYYKQDFVFRNNPLLESINVGDNYNLNHFLSLTIENCPNLNYVKLTNYYQNSPDKNIDQLLIDRDNSGILDGTWWTDTTFVYTAVSDAARANLIAKGWTLKFTK